jgi:hypothetical protein
MILKESAASEIVTRMHKRPELVDIMMDIEEYLDNSSVYVFENWINGVIVSGPSVRKYWVDVILKYEQDQMPDPQGGLRLIPHGTKVKYQKAWELVPQPINSPSDYQPGTKKPKMIKQPIWLVHLSIPKRFVEAVDQGLLDNYDDQADDIESAEDQLGQGGSTR